MCKYLFDLIGFNSDEPLERNYCLENDENKEITDKYKLIRLHKYLHLFTVTLS